MSLLDSLTSDMLIAAGVLTVAYVLIFTEAIHRTSAALLGAVCMVGVGMLLGFYSQEAAIQAIDANTLLLLAAMMMLVAMLRRTGVFEYIAVVIARLAAHDPRLLLLYLGVAVSLISMFLDNVTTIIVFAPLTVLIARILQLNPLPYLMSEAILSNIGGAATLVGDPPNLMIGSAAGIGFTEFLAHMGPMLGATWIGTTLLLMFVFRRQLDPASHQLRPLHFDLGQAIKDARALRQVILALVLVITLFFIHHQLHIFPAFAALIGLVLAMVLVRPRPERLFGEVNWSVLVFFAGLFVIIGGVEASGLLELLGRHLAQLAREPSHLLLAGLVLLWVSALMSAMIDNIPFTITMIPILLGLDLHGADATPLWWALALGVGLGGNSTHIGATANLIAVTEAERCGLPGAKISPAGWMRVGIPATLLGLCLASVAYSVYFLYFLR